MHTVQSHGAQIPALGFGTYGMSDEQLRRIIPAAIQAGFRHIDTAQLYNNESGVGEAWRGSGVVRSQFFITTKVWVANYGDESFESSVNDSLRRLRTDYIDLLLLHWPSEEVPLKAQIEHLNTLVDQGKVRHIGVSNYNTALLESAVRYSRYPLVTHQFEYHPYLNQRRVIHTTRELGMTVTAYCPMAIGRVLSEPVLLDIARGHRRSVAQVVLRWVIQQPGMIALSRTTNASRLTENVGAFDFELDTDDMARIHALAQANSRIVDPPGLAPQWDSTDTSP
jgi:2,5-diketo-D-gluconate reductase B